jgi:hypothetical protein
MAIHTGKGLFDPYSFEWNIGVEVGPTDATAWDWRYPQFLHNAERHVQRNLDYGIPVEP